ncbi:hypothetical protein E8E13_010826 [Curvularia kusanoi]|uniref:Uncharacterized protein n=1 Tax=Curvularia kusanoi TaxID=90978 RepID=A0A9P4TLK6_CURKU|nr:hypothetical protein E8E13_010826 [Curvularia kusanoi]
MDGGDQQKHKASLVKTEVKRNVARQRGRAQVCNGASTDVLSAGYTVISDLVDNSALPVAKPTVAGQRTGLAQERTNETVPHDQPSLLDTLPWSHQQQYRSDTLEQASASEWNFIMKYLDFVVPALFPFYQPHIFDTGRSWILLLLRKSKIAYHAALGLSCYYFTLTLSDAEKGREHAECKQLRWDDVERETMLCFDSLRTDIMALNLDVGQTPGATLKRVGLFNSITQVIIFEMTLGKSAPWATHLPAAITLFEEIMASPEAQSTYRGQRQSKFASVLLGIEDPMWTNPGPSNHIWSASQTGFRFCAGMLIFIDIIASTVLGETPRLLRYHNDVLSVSDDGLPAVGEAEIRLSSIVGCHNRVAELIADISSLSSWKHTKSDMRHDQVSNQSRSMDSRIRTRIQDLQQTFITDLDSARLTVSNQIWGFAAEIYYILSVEGWHSTNPSIRANVKQIIENLANVPSDVLRTVTWPICIAGCFADRNEETFFLALFLKLSYAQSAGALCNVQGIVEGAWLRREELSKSGLDWASGFSLLGPQMLLI